MKRNLLMLLGMLCMVLVCTGCGMMKTMSYVTENQKETDDETGMSGEETESSVGTEAASDMDEKELRVQDLVQDAFSRTETVILYEDTSIEVDYHVPEILSDSEGAKEINREIMEDCQELTQELSEENFVWCLVEYEAYLNGDILSLLLTKHSIFEGDIRYYAYNLNMKTGRKMEQRDLIQSLEFETRQGESAEDAMLRYIRKAAAYQSDQEMQSFFESDYHGQTDTQELQYMYAWYLMMRMETLQEDNISLELPMYLNEQGELQVVVPVYVMAGAGVYDEILTPLEEHTSADRELRFDDAVTVSYEGGRMTVCIERNDWTESAFGTGNLEFGKEYEVDGVYKDYVDASILMIMYGEYVVPVFVSEDGMVSYLNLYAGAAAGYFCITEPVCGLTQIEAIAEGTSGEVASALEEMIFEQSPDFPSKVMGLYEGEGLSTETTFDTDAGTQYTDHYYFGFDMEREWICLYQDSNYDAGLYTTYEGKCTYLGMNEKGMVIAYSLYENTDTEPAGILNGAFLERRRGSYNEQTMEWRDWADYRTLSGYDLFGTGSKERELDISVG